MISPRGRTLGRIWKAGGHGDDTDGTARAAPARRDPVGGGAGAAAGGRPRPRAAGVGEGDGAGEEGSVVGVAADAGADADVDALVGWVGPVPALPAGSEEHAARPTVAASVTIATKLAPPLPQCGHDGSCENT